MREHVGDRSADVPEARVLHNRRIARLGGLSFAATHDGRQATAGARDAFHASFEERVRHQFPELTDTAEIERRADALRRLHYAQLAYKSAAARTKKTRRP
jgi:hypothetical protein